MHFPGKFFRKTSITYRVQTKLQGQGSPSGDAAHRPAGEGGLADAIPPPWQCPFHHPIIKRLRP